ncbi:MAG TPA: sigma-54 dependent transcriptional regulator [bacterium]|nr:sigma-54 dependent transcriptional regulator [bacterium]
MKGSVLIIDDEATFRDALARLLQRDGYEVETAPTCTEGLAAWSRVRPDIILLDFLLPDGNGIDTLTKIRQTDSATPVVMMTAFGSVESAVNAMRAGATDYVAKGADVIAEIRLKVEAALKLATLSDEIDYRRRHTPEEPEALGLLKASKALEPILQKVREVAKSPETTVLVRGESGTGKELVARAIHEAGPGASAPLVEVDCAAIPENLLESELFGHEKGAFSGADRQKRGLLELARGGTVLLDEIGEMPERLQAKLLRVLEERHFRRVGGTRNIDLGARIVAMTNRDLAAMVKDGRFREDLFYRLQVFEIVIPPLRARIDDALTIAEYFVTRFNRKLGKRVQGLSPDARAYLKAYDFPGNVRELRNMIERAMVRATGDWIHLELISGGGSPLREDYEDSEPVPPRKRPAAASASPVAPAVGAPAAAGAAQPPPVVGHTPSGITTLTFVLGRDHLSDVEKRFVHEAIRAAQGNKTKAAEMLGISRFQLLRKLGREDDSTEEIKGATPEPPAEIAKK